MAAAEMAELGYKTIFSIKSGLLAWRALGYPMTE
jgi:rhodanese-related sulfurtransferase